MDCLNLITDVDLWETTKCCCLIRLCVCTVYTYVDHFCLIWDPCVCIVYTYVDHFCLVWGGCVCVLYCIHVHRQFLFILVGEVCMYCIHCFEVGNITFSILDTNKHFSWGGSENMWPGTYYCFLSPYR